MFGNNGGSCNGSSNYGTGAGSCTPSWLFPVTVWCSRPGK